MLKPLGFIGAILLLVACSGDTTSSSSGSSSGSSSSSSGSNKIVGDVARGKTLYEDKDQGCATCHGKNGEGASPFPPVSSSKTKYVHESENGEFSLPDYLVKFMPPFGRTSVCGGQCATDIAAYINSQNWNPNLDDGSGKKELSCDADKVKQHGNSPIRMLTKNQLSNLLADTFSPLNINAAEIAKDLTDDISLAGFATNYGRGANFIQVSSLDNWGAKIGKQAADNFSQLMDCNSADNNCLRSFAEKYGRLLFRRALSDGELDNLMSVAEKAANDDAAVEAVVIALVLAPQTSYVMYDKVNARTQLSGVELASKLAFLIWDRAPDDDLLQAGENGDLDSENGVLQKAQQMLNDDRAVAGLQFFYENWLSTKTDEADKTNAPLKVAAADEIRRLMPYLTLVEDAKFADIYTSTTSVVDNTLADLYGVNAQGQDYLGGKVVQLPAGERSGLLTRAAFLQKGSNGDVAKITIRGTFIRDSVLCDHIEEPDADVQDQFPLLPTDYDLTYREKLEITHLNAGGACQGCHELLDPIGFAFENYDGTGAYRTEYVLEDSRDATPNGPLGPIVRKPIDSTGYVVDGADKDIDIVGDFSDGFDLSNKIANSETASQCYSELWFSRAFGRYIDDNDACSARQMFERFKEKDFSLKEMVYAVVTNPNFRFRNP